MKWLVTFSKPTQRATVVAQLQTLHCAVDEEQSILLGDDEEVLAVEGPANLPDLVRPLSTEWHVYPNSSMSAY